MENYHIIEVKYLGATNTKGSRVKLTSHRLNESITFSYDYSIGNINKQAEKYLKSINQIVIGQAEGKSVDYIILDSVDGQFLSIK